jgi:hypothetical protein
VQRLFQLLLFGNVAGRAGHPVGASFSSRSASPC